MNADTSIIRYPGASGDLLAERLDFPATAPSAFVVSLDNADHLLTKKEDAVYVTAVLSAWASRYLGSATARAVPNARGAPS